MQSAIRLMQGLAAIGIALPNGLSEGTQGMQRGSRESKEENTD